MTRGTTLLVLFLAALLEAGGDAAMRQRTLPAGLLGAAMLALYGWLVNAPPWDFGRLLGVYVVFFFLISQAIAYLQFHESPTPALLLGGALITAGGLVIAIFN